MMATDPSPMTRTIVEAGQRPNRSTPAMPIVHSGRFQWIGERRCRAPPALGGAGRACVYGRTVDVSSIDARAATARLPPHGAQHRMTSAVFASALAAGAAPATGRWVMSDFVPGFRPSAVTVPVGCPRAAPVLP